MLVRSATGRTHRRHPLKKSRDTTTSGAQTRHSRSVSPVKPILRASCLMAGENCSETTTVKIWLQGISIFTRLWRKLLAVLFRLDLDPHARRIFGIKHTGKQDMAVVNAANIRLCPSWWRRNILTPCRFAQARFTTTATFVPFCKYILWQTTDPTIPAGWARSPFAGVIV